MTRIAVEAIIRALNARGVRYLVAGGLAVVAHGYVRFTADVDLMLDLESENVEAAIAALETLGYRPRAPVPFRDLADPHHRAQWVREKGLTVFSLHSAEYPATEVDVFVESPIEFDAAYAAAAHIELAPGVRATFVSYDDLIRLKRQASRPQDLEDVRQLRRLKGEPTDER